MAKIRTATIVKAAEQAYTPYEVDYSGYVKGIAAINKLITDKVGLANEQDTTLMDYEQEDFAGINKSILSEENVAFLTDIRTQMAEDSQAMKMSAGFTKTHKQASKRWNDNLLLLQQLKKDATTYTSWFKEINKNKDFLSDYQGPLDQNFLASVAAEPDMVNSNIKFTKEGMLVFDMGVEDLPSGTTFKDGAAISDAISDQIDNIEAYNSEGIYDKNKEAKVKHDLAMFLKGQTSNAIGSGIFDYEYATEDGIISYIDVLFKENPDLEIAYNQRIQDSLSEEDPIDTDGEKASLRKKLIRGLDDFSLEKMKDGFVKWIHDEVFENASSIASSAYKKKITKAYKSKPKSKEEIATLQLTQGLNLETGTYSTKSSLYGLDITGGDKIISGTKLEEITKDDQIFQNEDFAGGETEYKLDTDGILWKAVSSGKGDDRTWSWKKSKFQENSKSNKYRDKYNLIGGVMDKEFEDATQYFGETIDGDKLNMNNVHFDSSITDESKRVYVEKITHTHGNRKGSGAKTGWFHGKGGLWADTFGKGGEVDIMPRIDKWFESMGFESKWFESCEEDEVVDINGDAFMIYNVNCTSNDIRIYAPDGKSFYANTNQWKEDSARDYAVALDKFVNDYYLRAATKDARFTNKEVEDLKNPGQYIGENTFDQRSY